MQSIRPRVHLRPRQEVARSASRDFSLISTDLNEVLKFAYRIAVDCGEEKVCFADADGFIKELLTSELTRAAA